VSPAGLKTAGDRIGEGQSAALGAADCLRFAAAPTFTVMALLTALPGSGMPDMLCSSASPLSGMVPMYLMMSVFHAPPWLKLIAGRRSGGHRPEARLRMGA
jgi:hypothetical protein